MSATGRQEAWLVDLARERFEQGHPDPIPKALLDRPMVPEHLQGYWEAFWLLSSSRYIGFSGGGPIPLPAILDYFKWAKIDDGEQEEFMRYIRILDGLYLEAQARAAKEKA